MENTTATASASVRSRVPGRPGGDRPLECGWRTYPGGVRAAAVTVFGAPAVLVEEAGRRWVVTGFHDRFEAGRFLDAGDWRRRGNGHSRFYPFTVLAWSSDT